MNITSTTVALAVGDPAASSRFFTEYLGFRELIRTDALIQLERDAAADGRRSSASPDCRPRHGRHRRGVAEHPRPGCDSRHCRRLGAAPGPVSPS
ncbi:VOC family protein [Kitasatospora sp. NPDC002040]|uniref:VOC family protein n=1 Tax=Kitasatospora sp. NPDC002040 TaxID=3154661 RepID=UPI0033323A1F